jgi:endonuclease YncB( thermonuclease family)
MGTLRIYGTIDINQFWPNGSADADTTKIKLIVGEEAFEYKEENENIFSKTFAFNDAISKGQGNKPVIKTSKRDGTKTITIRLQGVDAPELHYKAAPLKRTSDISEEERSKFNAINEERRQCYAETSTFVLAEYLKQFSNEEGQIDAIFETNVEKPFEVIDTYGRFIGNVFVGSEYEHDINIWLVENGWGMPAFYTSMKIEEIQVFLEAWKKGKKKVGRIGKAISNDAGNFDWELIYRKPSPDIIFNIGDDEGSVLMPKIFRRQNAWMVGKKAGVLTKNTKFQSYLKKSPDQLVLLDELINNGLHSATVYNLHDFVSTDNQVLKDSEELVFKEKPGTLVDSEGKKITKW